MAKPHTVVLGLVTGTIVAVVGLVMLADVAGYVTTHMPAGQLAGAVKAIVSGVVTAMAIFGILGFLRLSSLVLGG